MADLISGFPLSLYTVLSTFAGTLQSSWTPRLNRTYMWRKGFSLTQGPLHAHLWISVGPASDRSRFT